MGPATWAEYELETVSGYPMAFFPGERNVYRPPSSSPLNRWTWYSGRGEDDAKSIAFHHGAVSVEVGGGFDF